MPSDRTLQNHSMTMNLYYSIYILYGSLFFLYGPLIPYFSEESGHPEGQFIPVVTARSLGYLFGSYLKISLFGNLKNIHDGLKIGCIGSGIGAILFSLSYNWLWLTGVSFIFSIFMVSTQIFLEYCILKNSREDEVEKNMAKGYAMEALGAVIGPLALIMLNRFCLIILGVGLIVLGLLCTFLQSVKSSETDEVHGKPLTKRIRYLTCFLFFTHVAVALSYKSWLPTFCYMLGYASKEEAAFLVCVITIVMIITCFVLKTEVVKMLRVGIYGVLMLFFSAVIAYYLSFVWYLMYGTSIVFGILTAFQFAYYLTLPSKFGFQVSHQDCGSFMVAYATGEAILISAMGILMEYTHPISLHYFVIVVLVFQAIAFQILILELKKSQAENKQKLLTEEIEMKVIKNPETGS